MIINLKCDQEGGAAKFDFVAETSENQYVNI